jgi:NTP pyrophosphatase (non-canonical NTP hydrolase)
MSRQHALHHHATLADLQARVDAWISQFEEGYWPPLSMLARLTEEVGELARELNHSFGHKPKKSNEPAGNVALEVADIIFVLVCLCNSLRIDLGDAFERVMHKYDRRDGRRWTPRVEVARSRRGRGGARLVAVTGRRVGGGTVLEAPARPARPARRIGGAARNRSGGRGRARRRGSSRA